MERMGTPLFLCVSIKKRRAVLVQGAYGDAPVFMRFY
jgi:hypothetical protein